MQNEVELWCEFSGLILKIMPQSGWGSTGSRAEETVFTNKFYGVGKTNSPQIEILVNLSLVYEQRKLGMWKQKTCVLPSSASDCVTIGRSLSLSEPLFLHPFGDCDRVPTVSWALGIKYGVCENNF